MTIFEKDTWWSSYAHFLAVNDIVPFSRPYHIGLVVLSPDIAHELFWVRYRNVCTWPLHLYTIQFGWVDQCGRLSLAKCTHKDVNSRFKVVQYCINEKDIQFKISIKLNQSGHQVIWLTKWRLVTCLTVNMSKNLLLFNQSGHSPLLYRSVIGYSKISL